MKRKRYTAKRRNINAEKRRVLAMIGTIIRAYEGTIGSAHERTRGAQFIYNEINRDAHRGQR